MARTRITSLVKRGRQGKRSLRLKLILISSGIILITSMLISAFLYNIAEKHLDKQINEKGYLIEKTLASLDPEYWKSAILDKKKGKAPFVPIKDMAELRSVRQLAVQLWNKDQTIGLVSLHSIESKYISRTNIDSSQYGDNLEITEGMIRETVQERTTETSCRAYKLTKDAGDGLQLIFWLILSLQEIENAKGALQQAILLPAIIALFIGIAAAVISSYTITKPINMLMKDIAEVSKGNLDHVSFVNSNDEIGLLSDTFNKMTSLLKKAHERELKQTALEHELSIARQIQFNLLPKENLNTDNFIIDAFYRPSKEVGGDYYDCFKLNEDHLGIVIADVSGKGIPASIIMSMFRILLRTEAIENHNISTRDTLIKVNEILAKDMKKGMFVTAYYMILNTREKMMSLSSAGHNPIYLVKNKEKKLYTVNPGGLAVGIYSGKLFRDSFKESKIPIDEGDSLLAYTDGAVECTDSKYNFFGEERLKQIFLQASAKEPSKVVDLIAKQLQAFQNGTEQHDDITLLNLKRK